MNLSDSPESNEPLSDNALRAQLAEAGPQLPLLKAQIAAIAAQQSARFAAGDDIVDIVCDRALAIDQLLRALWDQVEWQAEIHLIAVGGYGRGELHPYSDIDLLILVPEDGAAEWGPQVEQFVTRLWDLGLDIGHSVRSMEECVKAAMDDITIATALMEVRLLSGKPSVLEQLRHKTGPTKMWDSADFFSAKWKELLERHRKYAHSEYPLEPNIKNSPGGLRDIQIIGWVAKRHFDASSLEDLQHHGFLTPEELTLLLNSRDFLWRVRFALHEMNGREEDRLLFDHQRALATRFGFADDDAKLAVEGFMQRYYRCVKNIGELRDMLIQLFEETILNACAADDVWQISPHFNVRNNFLEACNDRVFERFPTALLETFMLLAQNTQLQGIRASTIRLIRSQTHLIDDAFRAEPRNQQLFLQILRSPGRIAQQLRLMHRLGVLGAYLPEWAKITGQMQHDLFHVYTVDAHTLELIKNLRRFHYEEFVDRYPLASKVIKRIPKPELLYIAGLYHDIAKGRGGDHSKLGIIDARDFCQRHNISSRDTNLVAWLVEHHLLMSRVSQREDIQDPEVIGRFATLVGDQSYLDYLYCLTVADINATNPTLWNNWRASLMRQLYTETTRALSRGLENPFDRSEWVQETQIEAIQLLQSQGFSEQEVRAVWGDEGDDYFLRETASDIAWHTEAIAGHKSTESPIVLLRDSTGLANGGATQIFVRCRAAQSLFAVIATALDQLDLSIQDARIYGSQEGFSLNTFYVLDADGQSLGNNPERTARIRSRLLESIDKPERYGEIVQRRTPRQMRLFNVPTHSSMSTDTVSQLSVLEVTTADRPGLLARLGRILYDYGIALQTAKITTLGERVEDVFFVHDQDGQPIEDPELCAAILQTIREELDEQIDESDRTLLG